MPKSRRLSRSDFPKQTGQMRRISSPLYTLSISKSEAQQSRFAVIVSKKVSQKATERNTIKRRFRAALSKLTINNGLAVIVVIKREARGVSGATIHTHLEASLQEARLIGERQQKG